MSKQVEEYTVQRVTYHSALPPSEVLAQLDKLVHRDASDGQALPALLTSKTKGEIVQRLNDISGGDFMVFGTLRHSDWIKTYFEMDAMPTLVSYKVGSPLVATTMLAHTLLTSLYLPTKILIVGKDVDESKGTKVIYDLPSSMIAAGDRGDLRDAALVLDAKLEDLTKRITGAL
ncbi:hypothetical protein BV25DRAFT_1915863 [Artomyces pyxidatus]|uniref:Uncharacterized protein n=1 Tax=Artomyces pyxidatus TaxID=48021 RepID=A0ACB8T3Q9_9AGAM|nr:hypothetical protein BV25DRAFT_1915863 [Artomyces pyxidatus]